MIPYPGATIGILGDGQLGRMLALDARRMGYRAAVLGPNRNGAAGQVADVAMTGALGNLGAALRLARLCDVVTLETEHVPADVLAAVAEVRPLRPGAEVLATVQDRLRQKSFLARHGLPQAIFAPVGSVEEAERAAGAVPFPAILKSRTAGYDGKGQVRVDSADALAAAHAAIGRRPAVLEAVVPFAREISVILARGADGEMRPYPVAENEHRNHVLYMTRVPARIDRATERHASEIAMTIAEALDHVGVMAVELFVLDDGTLLVNEIAPRVHNSGHYSLGASATSQFEQHVRAVCGLPLGETTLLRPAAMVNLFGETWLDRPAVLDRIVRHPAVRIHLYGKHPPERGRKMGHVLVLGESADEAARLAEAVASEAPAEAPR